MPLLNAVLAFSIPQEIESGLNGSEAPPWS